MKAVTSSQSARSLLDSIVARAGSEPLAMALREQAALVRALLDEVQRRAPGDPFFVDLNAQLDEEVGRLAQLLVDESHEAQRAAS